jgi:hypothetical protein
MADDSRPGDWRARECPYPSRAGLEAAMRREARVWKPSDRSPTGILSRIADAARDWEAQERSNEEEAQP